MSVSLIVWVRSTLCCFLRPTFLRATFYLALQWNHDKNQVPTDYRRSLFFKVSAYINIINLARLTDKITHWQDSFLLSL